MKGVRLIKNIYLFVNRFNLCLPNLNYRHFNVEMKWAIILGTSSHAECLSFITRGVDSEAGGKLARLGNVHALLLKRVIF